MAQDLVIKVVGDTKSVESAFKRTSKASNTLEKDLIRVGKRAAIAVGALGVAAGAASFKLVKMAGDAEEVRSKFQVTFQQEMPRMVRQLDAFSKSTGASRFELRQQAADLGALLVPLSASRKEAGNLSVQFTKLATDLSSFNNVPVGDALLAIRSGLVGEAEPLRRFGVLLNEAAVKQEALRLGLIKGTQVMTEQQKVQARASLIMKQTTLAQGDAERTAGSFTNQMRKLQNQVKDTATELGLKLLPIATTVLTKLNEWGPAIANKVRPQLDALAKWADENREEFTDLFKDIVDGAEKAGKKLRQMGGDSDEVVQSLGGWDEAIRLGIAGFLGQKFAKALARLGGGAGMAGLLTKIKALGPAIAITIGIDLVLSDKVDKLTKWLDKKTSSGVFSFSGLDLFRAIGILGDGPTAKPATTTPQGTAADPRGGTVGSAGTSTGSVSVQPRRLPAGQGAAPVKGHVIEFVRRIAAAWGSPLTIWDNSTHNQFVSGTKGTVQSAHWTGDAADIPMSGAALIRLGQTALIVAGASPAVAYKQTGGAYNVNGVNILFNTMIGGDHTDHVHVGLHALPSGTGAGTGTKTVAPGSKTTTAGGAGGGGTTAGGGTSGGKKATELVPAGLRLSLAKAEGTKNIGDDLTALRAMVAYLQKLLPKTKDIEKRIEITEALNGLRERIADLGKDKTKKKVDILSPADFAAMKAKLRENFRDGIKQAQDTIKDARSGFAAAFGILSDSLLTVFDAKTQKMLDNMRVQVAGFDFTTAAGEDTPTERMLANLREQKIDQGLQDALNNAKTLEDLQTARDALEERRLEKLARSEREAADKALSDERKRIEDERALKRDGFVNALADLEKQWVKTNATTKQRTTELNALLAKFDLPFQDVGALLGKSFADGFMESLQLVFDRLADLARELNKITPAQAAEAVIMAGGTALAARSAALNAKYGLGKLQSFATGGIVKGMGPQLAIVHGGETVVPRGAGMGGTVVNVYGDVSGTELVETVRREINRIQKRNGTAGYV